MAAVLTIHKHPDYPQFKDATHDMAHVAQLNVGVFPSIEQAREWSEHCPQGA